MVGVKVCITYYVTMSLDVAQELSLVGDPSDSIILEIRMWGAVFLKILTVQFSQ